MKQSIVAVALLLTASCTPGTEPSRTEQHEASPSARVHVAENQSFTLGEARGFRQRFEPAFTSWSGGGDLSRSQLRDYRLRESVDSRNRRDAPDLV